MITEFDQYYQYTMKEVRYKLFYGFNQMNASTITDENLKFLIKLYILHKLGKDENDKITLHLFSSHYITKKILFV